MIAVGFFLLGWCGFECAAINGLCRQVGGPLPSASLTGRVWEGARHMFSASSPGSPAVGGWGLVDALLLPPGKTVSQAVVPHCSRTHLAAWLLGRFYLSGHQLVQSIVLREHGVPPGRCEVTGEAVCCLWVHRKLGHHSWEGDLSTQMWSL